MNAGGADARYAATDAQAPSAASDADAPSVATDALCIDWHEFPAVGE
jgi:hypothetical protein